jgi:hypothetical protein
LRMFNMAQALAQARAKVTSHAVDAASVGP